MPTLEEMRRWLRGEDVEGFPPHKPKPFEPFEIQPLSDDIRCIEGQGAVLEFEHGKKLNIGKWGIHFKALHFFVDMHIDMIKDYISNQEDLAGFSRFINWIQSGEYEPVEAWLTTDARRRVWHFQNVFPLHVERNVCVDKPQVTVMYIKFKFGQWIAMSTMEACMKCGSKEGVKLEDSRTQYEWDGIGEDPNSPIPLCRECAKEHHEEWDERWQEYYSGRL